MAEAYAVRKAMKILQIQKVQKSIPFLIGQIKK